MSATAANTAWGVTGGAVGSGASTGTSSPAPSEPDGTILTGEPGADPRPSTGATVAAHVLAQPEVVPCGAESGADEGGDL